MLKKLFKKQEKVETKKESSPFTIKYKSSETEEIQEVELTSENLDKIMSDKNARLIFK